MELGLHRRGAGGVPSWRPSDVFIGPILIGIAPDGEFHLNGVNAACWLAVVAGDPAAFEAAIDNMAVARTVSHDCIGQRGSQLTPL